MRSMTNLVGTPSSALAEIGGVLTLLTVVMFAVSDVSMLASIEMALIVSPK